MSSFSKDVFKLATAPIVTQIMSILLTPVITRLYLPSDFGIWQLFSSISAPLLVFATLGYSVPIMIAEKTKDKLNLFLLSIVISVIFSFFIGLVFFAGFDILNVWLKIENIRIIIWVLPLSLLLHGFYITLRYWNLYDTKFHLNAICEIFRNVGNYFVILPFGFLGYANANSLILGSFASSITTVLALSFGQIKSLCSSLILPGVVLLIME